MYIYIYIYIYLYIYMRFDLNPLLLTLLYSGDLFILSLLTLPSKHRVRARTRKGGRRKSAEGQQYGHISKWKVGMCVPISLAI